MNSDIRYVGLDVHADTFSVAVADSGQDSVSYIGKYPHRIETVLKVLRRLGPAEQIRVAYEAGPTGYTLYRALLEKGIECHVVAPTLVPVKAGDRVKTDRRDAEKLARNLRSGDLTDVWVPSVESEGFRDLVRTREDAKADQLRARHRLSKFLLRHGQRAPMKAWSKAHLDWLRTQRFDLVAHQVVFDDYMAEVEHANSRVAALENKIAELIPSLPEQMKRLISALQSMRGIALITSVTLVSEIESFSRFESPRQLMSYVGVVPSESSSGASVRRGGITKTGNAHVRRVLMESAWNARFIPKVAYALRRRQSDDPQVRETAWRAQQRLHKRYTTLKARGKVHQKVLVAVAREMLGFIWDIACTVEHKYMLEQRSAA